MFKALARFIRSLDLTSIVMGIVAKVGGPFGWLLSLVARPVAKGIEKGIDNGLEAYEAAADSDEKIDQAVKDHVTKVEQAKTDEELDEAFRDSLR